MVKRKSKISILFMLVLSIFLSRFANVSLAAEMMPEMSVTDNKAPRIVSDTNAANEGSWTKGSINAASSGVQGTPSLLSDGSYGMIKGQKWNAGAGAISSDRRVLRVSPKGMVKARKAGVAEISLYGAMHRIMIYDPVLSHKKITLPLGESMAVSLNGMPDGQRVSWITKDPDVAQVADGRIYATGEGSTRVFALAGGKRFAVRVRVNANEGATTLMDIPVAKAVKLNILGAAKVNWTTSDNGISVRKGKVSVTAPGMYTLRSDKNRVRVYGNDPAIDLSTGLYPTGKDGHYALKMKTGEKFFISFPNSHECPLWRSSDPLVASVDGYGIIYADAPGSAKLKARISGKKVIIMVTVGNESTIVPGKEKLTRQLVDSINSNKAVYMVFDPSTGEVREEVRKSVSDNRMPGDKEEKREEDSEIPAEHDTPSEGEKTEDNITDGEDTPSSDKEPSDSEEEDKPSGKDSTSDEDKPSDDKKPSDDENPSDSDNPSDEKKASDSDESSDSKKHSETDDSSDPDKKSDSDKHSEEGKKSEDKKSSEDKKTSEDGKTSEDEGRKGEDTTSENSAAKEDEKKEGEKEAEKEPVKLTVTFDTDGGSRIEEQLIPYAGKVEKPEDPVKEHYNFIAWYKGEYLYDFSNAIVEDTTLKARYEKKVYSVSFNAEGGECKEKGRKVVYSEKIGELPVPVKNHYNFTGWFNASTGGKEIDKEFVIEEDAEVFAHWDPKKYKITFDPKGGTCYTKEKSVTYRESFGTLPVAERTGYDFKGWSTSASGNPNVTSSTEVDLSKDITLYAIWTPKEYKIVFNANGGYCSEKERKVVFDSRYGKLPQASRSGHTFIGWYYSPTGGVRINDNDTVSVAGNRTLYAVYSVNSYTVTFNARGGSCQTASSEVKYGQTYGTLPAPSLTGYTFTGWYTDPSGGTKINSSTGVSITSAQTLYAHWSANSYKVYFNANGGSCYEKERSVTYSGKYGTLPSPSRTGHTFTGWYTASSGGTRIYDSTQVSITSAQTLYAHWSANTYKVKFNATGGTADKSEISVTYGSSYGTLPRATLTGYTFNGWYTAASGGSCISAGTTVSITSDQILYARWTANTYKVTFVADGGSVNFSESKVTYGGTYGTLPKAEKEGYNFMGWFTAQKGGKQISASDKITITSDQKLYAHYHLTSYVLKWSAPLARVGNYLSDKGGSAETRGWKRIKYTAKNGDIVYANPYSSNGKIYIRPGSIVYLEAIAGDAPSPGHFYSDITWYVGNDKAVGNDFNSHNARQLVSSHYQPRSNGVLSCHEDQWARDDDGKNNFWWHVRFTES